MTSHLLDLSGLKCPMPALRTRKALRRLTPGHEIEVTCTDPMAAIDVPNVVREAGDELIETIQRDSALVFRIRKLDQQQVRP